LVLIEPVDGCLDIQNGEELKDAIVLVKRGSCKYIDKALNVEKFGGVGMVVGNSNGNTLIQMPKSGSEDVPFPCVFVAESTYDAMVSALESNPSGTVIATISMSGNIPASKTNVVGKLIEFFVQVVTWLLAGWIIIKLNICWRGMCNRRHQRQRQQRSRDIPEIAFQNDLLDPESEAGKELIRRRNTRLTNNSCPICLEFFEEDVKIKLLPCEHGFHPECIRPWILDNDSCPICRQSILDKLDSKCRCCCWCCSFPDEAELTQPLLLSDAEEVQIDIGTPVVEYIDESELGSLRQEDEIKLSTQPNQEPAEIDNKYEVKVPVYDEYQPNSTREYRVIESKQVEVSKNSEFRRSNNV